jgi:hypothetical protein
MIQPNLNLIGYGALDYLVMAFFVIGSYWIGFTRPRQIMWLLPSAMTFYFFVRVVTILTPIKVVPFFFLLGVLMRGDRGYLVHKNTYWHKWFGVWFLISMLIGLIYTPILATHPIAPVMRTRLVVQFINNVNLILLFLIVRKECSFPGGFQRFLKAWIYTTIVLCIYGVYQWLAAQFGLPFRGIIYHEGRSNAAVDFINFIFRINSFANEPKRLSYILMVSVAILVAYRQYWQTLFRRKWIYFLTIGLHLLCTFWTYATSIFLSIGVFLGIMVLWGLRKRSYRVYWKATVYGTLLFAGLMYFNADLRERLELVYEIRVSGQLRDVGTEVNPRQEIFAIDYFKMHPWQTILGIGPGNYNFALYNEFGHDRGLGGPIISPLNTAPWIMPLNSGHLNLIFDFGIIGWLIIWWPLFANLLGRYRYKDEAARLVVIPTLIMLFTSAITLNPMIVYFAFLGAFDAARKLPDASKMPAFSEDL